MWRLRGVLRKGDHKCASYDSFVRDLIGDGDMI